MSVLRFLIACRSSHTIRPVAIFALSPAPATGAGCAGVWSADRPRPLQCRTAGAARRSDDAGARACSERNRSSAHPAALTRRLDHSADPPPAVSVTASAKLAMQPPCTSIAAILPRRFCGRAVILPACQTSLSVAAMRTISVLNTSTGEIKRASGRWTARRDALTEGDRSVQWRDRSGEKKRHGAGMSGAGPHCRVNSRQKGSPSYDSAAAPVIFTPPRGSCIFASKSW